MSSRWHEINFGDREKSICFGRYSGNPYKKDILDYVLTDTPYTWEYVELLQKVVSEKEVVFSRFKKGYTNCLINAHMPGCYVMGLISTIRLADECYKGVRSTGTYCNDFPRVLKESRDITNPLVRLINISVNLKGGLPAHMVFLPGHFKVRSIKKYVGKKKMFRSLYIGDDHSFYEKGYTKDITRSFGLSTDFGGLGW